MRRWVSLNKAATQIVAALPSGAAALNAKYSNTVTKLFQSAVKAKFTAVRLFLHGEDESSQLQTQPGQRPRSYIIYACRVLEHVACECELDQK